MPGKKRAHYKGDYPRRAAAVTTAAYANPNTRCWRCGKTLEEIRRGKPNEGWDAGHLVDGAINGTLQAECRGCNRSHGAAMGNARRTPTSQQW